MKIGILSIIAWNVVGLSIASADEAARYAPTGVLALGGTSACDLVSEDAAPSLVETRLGLARDLGDGTYGWICPAAWGGGSDPIAAAGAGGTPVVVVSRDDVWVSVEGDCAFEPRVLPEDEVAVQAFVWRQAPWVLTHSGAGGALYRESGEGLVEVLRWADRQPDGASGDTTTLWVGGAGPTPWLSRYSWAGGLALEGDTTSLPDATQRFEYIRPEAATGDEAWTVVRANGRSWTWHTTVNTIVGAETTWELETTAETARHIQVSGPIAVKGRWWSVRGGVLSSADPLVGTWTDRDSVGWSCFDSIGDNLYACSDGDVVAVETLTSADGPVTSPVFSALQFVGPDPSCTATCDPERWSETLVFEDPPATCADGSGPEDGSSGCQTAPSAPWWMLGLLVPWSRRRQGQGNGCSA
ncbi:MAG: MYXO-CTERM sorting domain-containing protein [Myxococcota bacterium]